MVEDRDSEWRRYWLCGYSRMLMGVRLELYQTLFSLSVVARMQDPV